MTALTALDREGLCPQQQQHEKREEINLFQFKPASEKKQKKQKCHRGTKGKQNASKEKDETRREQETGRGRESSLFHLGVAC